MRRDEELEVENFNLEEQLTFVKPFMSTIREKSILGFKLRAIGNLKLFGSIHLVLL